MDGLIQITSVPIIVTIVYGALKLYKSFVTNEKWTRIIPILAAGLGAVLGVVGFYAAPGVIPAGNVLVAILIGGASGLAATGTNQIYKQLTKNSNKSTDTEPDASAAGKPENKPDNDKKESDSGNSETENNDSCNDCNS